MNSFTLLEWKSLNKAGAEQDGPVVIPLAVRVTAFDVSSVNVLHE